MWGIRLGQRARPYAAAWPRGHAKSTSAQQAVVALGARAARSYVLYVMSTQSQANKAVSNIATLMTLPTTARYYPTLAQRKVNQYNYSLGWSRNQLRTASGFVVEAYGLDGSKRGANIEGQRPDLIVLDDIDEKDDTLEATRKKLEAITDTVLPMGTPDASVLYLQNLIIPTGIMTRLGIMAGRIESEVEPASFLTDVEYDGPIPAVEGMEVSQEQRDGRNYFRITRGIPTWAGMGIRECEALLSNEGLPAFTRERQNDVVVNPKALLNAEVIGRNRIHALPELEAVVVAVDPPAEGGGCGIVVKGRATIAGNRHTYTLEDASLEAVGPETWGVQVLKAYHKWGAGRVVGEVNQGGKMVEHVIRTTQLYEVGGKLVSGATMTDAEKAAAPCVVDGRYVPFVAVRATQSKQTRAEPVANRAHQGLTHNVGTHSNLERLWCYWTPGSKSPDPLDADVWAEYALVPELGADEESPVDQLTPIGWGKR